MFYWMYDLVREVATRLHMKAVNLLWIRPVMNAVRQNAAILEIGGGYNPRFIKENFPNVFHLDHANTEELRAKYASDPTVSHLVDKIQPIDFITDGSPIDELLPQKQRFDVIFSSHAVEHQVDLIGHFISLEKLLKPDGRVILVIPDYRCCFDALRFPTVVSDAVAAHRRGGPVHGGKQIFDFVSRTIDVNPNRKLWAFDIANAKFNHSLTEGFESMLKSEQSGAAYEDAHAWVFSPDSFRLLMLELYILGFTRLRPVSVSPTYANQFCAVLKRDEQVAAIEALDELEHERLVLTKKLRR